MTVLEAGKESLLMSGRRKEETGWKEEIIREIREIGQDIREEIRREAREVRKDIKEIKERLEELEKRRTLREENEGQEEEEKEEGVKNGQMMRELETGRRKRNNEEWTRTEMTGEEKRESSEEGWSEKEWGREWWEEVESEEERRQKERDENEEMKGTQCGQEGWKSTRRAGGKVGSEEKDKEAEKAEGRDRARRAAEAREEEVRRRRERKEREAEQKVQQEKKEMEERKRRGLIWRRVQGEGPKERKEIVEWIMERVLGRIVPVRKVVEVMGGDKKEVMFMELEEEEDKEEIIGRSGEIWRRWEIGVDEELTLEERAYRHRLVEKAKEERTRGRSAVLTNRRLWIDGKEIKWDEKGERWRKI